MTRLRPLSGAYECLMELEIIRWLRNRLPDADRVILGPRDYAAVVAWKKAAAAVVDVLLSADDLPRDERVIFVKSELEKIKDRPELAHAKPVS